MTTSRQQTVTSPHHGYSTRMLKTLHDQIDHLDLDNDFWQKFRMMFGMTAAPDAHGRHIDEVFLIHLYYNDLYKLFATYDVDAGLTLLQQIRSECS